MTVSQNERQLLRELAARVAEIAALPLQNERAELIKSLNRLRPKRPVVLVFPEGGWRDLVTDQQLQCQDEVLRGWERWLRSQIFRHENIPDDHPVPPCLSVGWVIQTSDFGLEVRHTRTEELGSFRWDPPVKSRADFQKLRYRTITVDRPETERRASLARDIFGDLLAVRVGGMLWWTVGLTHSLVSLRGLDQMMLDMYDDPQLLHDLMAFLRDDQGRVLEWFEAEGLLTLNNGPADYVGSGGLGCTDELPAADFNGHVRLKDMWGLAESQETVAVSPRMFEEFVLPYQLPIINRFGLACYGCCEPVDKRLDLIMKHIPRLRRVSISPWSDRAPAAGKLARRYIFSWKPNPALLCAPQVDWSEVERAVRETVAIARDCCLEMILKDTHTFCGDPGRPGRWAQLARRAIESA